MTPFPTVTAIIAVHQGERFVAQALTSVLEQDYPRERLDVVVVDDGSTDATAEVVRRIATAHPGRVQLLHQANAGNCAATSAGVAAARGELLALIDADDVWPADKTRRQVALLQARPEVGLVYGDMTVIDEQGEVLQRSWLAGDVTPEGVGVGPLLVGNNITASSVMLRAHVAAKACPIPAGLPYADWYLAVAIAQRWPIAYLERPRTLYRLHDANMCLGTQGPARVRALRKTLSFQRWCLRRLTPGSATPAELDAAWRAFEHNAGETLKLTDSPFAALVEVTDDDRRRARALGEEGLSLLRRGMAHDALIALVAAAACDPYDERARDGLRAALVTLGAGDGEVAPHPLAGAAPFVVAADASELLDEPTLLAAYVEALGGVPGVSLAIDADGLDASTAARQLTQLVATTGADDDRVDVIAVLGPLDDLARGRLAAGTHALLGRRGAIGHRAPRFGAGDLAALRQLVEARSPTPQAS
jgi:glycosyltransferase involved in cell wall biosynthesis